MNNQSLFEGNQVVLTAVDPEKDAAQFSNWSLDPDFVRHNFEGSFRPYITSEVKKKLKEDLKKADERRNQYYFAIREKEGERLVGLLRFAWVQSSHQIGHMILDFEDEALAEKYHQEVSQLALRYAFMELSLHRLSTVIPAYNEAEIGRYEREGFLRESQRRDAAFWDGKYYDQLVYALLKPDWKERQKEVTA